MLTLRVALGGGWPNDETEGRVYAEEGEEMLDLLFVDQHRDARSFPGESEKQ